MRQAFTGALLLSLLMVSCADDHQEQKKDSVVPNETAVAGQLPVKTVIETDSGKLEVFQLNGVNDGAAVLYGKDGKKIAEGTFAGGKKTGAWLRYDNNGKVIAAEHLSGDQVLHVLDVNDFDFIRYTNKEMGISFEVPRAWKELKSPNNALVASFEKPVNDKDVLLKPGFNLAKGKLQPGDNLKKLSDMHMQMLHNEMGRVELVDEENFTVDSCVAFRRYGMYYTKTSKAGFLNAIIIKGENVYVFDAVAQNKTQGEFLKYQSVFQHIAESLIIE
ncbi:MAG: hypothetical protein Fur0041_11680 [Bacteroidia bacterium]